MSGWISSLLSSVADEQTLQTRLNDYTIFALQDACRHLHVRHPVSKAAIVNAICAYWHQHDIKPTEKVAKPKEKAREIRNIPEPVPKPKENVKSKTYSEPMPMPTDTVRRSVRAMNRPVSGRACWTNYWTKHCGFRPLNVLFSDEFVLELQQLEAPLNGFKTVDKLKLWQPVETAFRSGDKEFDALVKKRPEYEDIFPIVKAPHQAERLQKKWERMKQRYGAASQEVWRVSMEKDFSEFCVDREEILGVAKEHSHGSTMDTESTATWHSASLTALVSARIVFQVAQIVVVFCW